MTKEPTILSALKDRGLRMTKARTAIADVMQKAHGPISALDVYTMLRKKGLTTDKVTVYRELASLENLKLISPVQLRDSIKRYERVQGHHHHLVCTGCETVEEVEMPHDLDGIEKTIGRKTSFAVQSHSLEFYGLCERCQ